MKHFFLVMSIAAIFIACKNQSADTSTETVKVNAVLDSLNAAAARADFNAYFHLYADESIFTGTDATERWNKKQFMAYAKPFFDKGRAWNFSSMERHVYFDETGRLAWFDELLSTQMKICRGSGVVVKEGNDWKIKQYILSATVPNEQVDSVTIMKSAIEDAVIKKITAKDGK
jgi:hypothetical protein